MACVSLAAGDRPRRVTRTGAVVRRRFDDVTILTGLDTARRIGGAVSRSRPRGLDWTAV